MKRASGENHTPVALPLVSPGHRFGKCVKICENFTMSTDLYLHEFVRALIATHRMGASEVKYAAPVAQLGKLMHRGGPSVASTTASSNLSTSLKGNLILVSDIEHLRCGDEHRTTLMIKRVPRKYACSVYRI